ncbi:unnamed protein product [Heligmosomoides polygyrus]|uniref:YDG domain-containing protein n=1 Tax=Heligmosomoides polygyrus TaxID=6339 RepID=A0A183F4N9_HELPZ|nr:unnamed protein product [Heligmosomoides polygyrus]
MNDDGGCPGKDDVIYLGEFTDDGEPVDETARNNTRALEGNTKPGRDGEPDEGRTYPRYPYGGMYIDGVFQPVPDDFGSYGGRRNGDRRRVKYDDYPRYRRTY